MLFYWRQYWPGVKCLVKQSKGAVKVSENSGALRPMDLWQESEHNIGINISQLAASSVNPPGGKICWKLALHKFTNVYIDSPLTDSQVTWWGLGTQYGDQPNQESVGSIIIYCGAMFLVRFYHYSTWSRAPASSVLFNVASMALGFDCQYLIFQNILIFDWSLYRHELPSWFCRLYRENMGKKRYAFN